MTQSPGARAAIFQLDSFTTTRFAGNPAAVVVLDHFLPDAFLHAIAGSPGDSHRSPLALGGKGVPTEACHLHV